MTDNTDNITNEEAVKVLDEAIKMASKELERLEREEEKEQIKTLI